MKTELDVDLELFTEMVGIILDDPDPGNLSMDTGIKVNVPRIMPRLKTTEHSKTSLCRTAGNTCFKNASDCKPRVSTTITETNYIIVKPKKETDLEYLKENIGKISTIPIKFELENLMNPKLSI